MPHDALPLADTSQRLYLSMNGTVSGSSASRVASPRIVNPVILRTFRIRVEGNIRRSIAVETRIAIADTASPAAADFIGSPLLIPTLHGADAFRAWTPESDGAAPWTPANIRIGRVPTRVIVEINNTNSFALRFDLQFILDHVRRGDFPHGSR